MAAGDILNLNTPMGERAIRWLYAIALIVIVIGALMGLARGIMIITHTPGQRPAATATADAPPTATPQATAPQTTQPQQGMMGRRDRFEDWRRFHHRRFGMMRGQPPMVRGLFVIIATLVRTLIVWLVIRALAEMGLAVLRMPRRN